MVSICWFLGISWKQARFELWNVVGPLGQILSSPRDYRILPFLTGLSHYCFLSSSGRGHGPSRPGPSGSGRRPPGMESFQINRMMFQMNFFLPYNLVVPMFYGFGGRQSLPGRLDSFPKGKVLFCKGGIRGKRGREPNQLVYFHLLPNRGPYLHLIWP